MTSNLGDSKTRKMRSVINDTYAFVRSMEVNRALSEVSLDNLISELIQRNGDSDRSAKTKYDPYALEPKKEQIADMPTVTQYGPAGNPVSGTDFGNPTKLDRLLALKNYAVQTIDEVKGTKPEEFYTSDEMFKQKSTDVD